jgi:SNF2 family DNA or RNA helicase
LRAGLGKTVQTTAFLAAIMLKNESAPVGKNQKPPEPAARALIVGPASILDQWKAELQRVPLLPFIIIIIVIIHLSNNC